MIALFFDTETTGIKTRDNPDFKPALVQLGCVLQDLDTGRVLAELNLIANQYPTAPAIPQGAINVHGITNELARDMGVDPKMIDLVFAELVKKADLIVAHNIDYDLDVVQDNMPLSQAALDAKRSDSTIDEFCTMQGNIYIVKAPLTDKQKYYFTSRGKVPDAPYKVPNLTETHLHYFGTPFEGAHDAMADIRACRDIFLAMIDKGWFEIVDGAVVHTTDKYDQMVVNEGSR